MSLVKPELLLPTGGIELIPHKPTSISPLFQSQTFEYTTAIVNQPTSQAFFVQFLGRGISIPKSQLEGPVGHISVFVSHVQEIAAIAEMFPFGIEVFSSLRTWLKGKGLAAGLHCHVVEDLAGQLNPKYSLYYSTPTPDARRHLSHLDIQPNRSYSIAEYLQRVTDSISRRSII